MNVDEIIKINGKEYSLLDHTPLLKPSWIETIKRQLYHPDAPKWNSHYGDRLELEDLYVVQQFKEKLLKARSPDQCETGKPPESIINKIYTLRGIVPGFSEKFHQKFDLFKNWDDIPTMSREDIATSPEKFAPVDIDMNRIIVYQTSGTTGHAMLVPHHPVAACSYEPMIEYVLNLYGIYPEWNPEMISTILVGAQKHTVTCATVVSSWNGAGFSKLNLNRNDWEDEKSPQIFFDNMDPFFLNGDPVSFSEMLKLKITCKPKAIFTTAIALSRGLKVNLEKYYKCPVIDWYSMNETGPIGYTCNEDNGFHILPHDIYVEILNPEGKQLSKGERGEIVITGGRNPCLPLLRYRTGDYGKIESSFCPCGDQMPRIVDLEGRDPVLFKSSDGRIVNPVDISQSLRKFSYVQHQFTQAEDLSCKLVIKPISDEDIPDEKKLKATIEELMGDIKINISFNQKLGVDTVGGKIIAYRSKFKIQ